MNEILAEGTWCASCGYFEEDAQFVDLPTTTGSVKGCQSCGCPQSSHREALVVKK